MSLVKALAPTPGLQTDQHEILVVEKSPLSRILEDEVKIEEINKAYLRRLAKIKIQHTRMIQLESDLPIKTIDIESIGRKLDLIQFKFESSHLPEDWDREIYRSSAIYRDMEVWVEWKETPNALGRTSQQRTQQIENRIRLLTDLLSSEKPERFRAPSCLGYVMVIPGEDRKRFGDELRFGIVFRKPIGVFQTPGKMVTLSNLLESWEKPSLSARITLSATLARCIHSFHNVNWLHKGLRSDNILFNIPHQLKNTHLLERDNSKLRAYWQEYEDTVLRAPYIAGFEMSRPSNVIGMSEKPESSARQDIYRHPRAQSRLDTKSEDYQKSYDIYSLGIALLEIALWRPIGDLLGVHPVHNLSPMQLQSVKAQLLDDFGVEIANFKIEAYSKAQEADGISASTSMADLKSTLKMEPMPRRRLSRQLSAECGDVFRDVVETCLRADEIEEAEYDGEPESSISIRLHRIMEASVVKKIQNMSIALQA